MKVLLFQPAFDSVGKRLEQILAPFMSHDSPEIHRTVDSLSARIRQSRHDIAIAVLLAPTTKDLLRLHAIRDLLKDLRIVLILPDSKKTTVSTGHELRPRFLTSVRGDFTDVTAVLEKMLQNILSSTEGKPMGDLRSSPV